MGTDSHIEQRWTATITENPLRYFEVSDSAVAILVGVVAHQSPSCKVPSGSLNQPHLDNLGKWLIFDTICRENLISIGPIP